MIKRLCFKRLPINYPQEQQQQQTSHLLRPYHPTSPRLTKPLFLSLRSLCQEGIKFTPLTINQGKWLRDKIANYVKLIEVSRRRLNFTPAAHATEVFGLTITPEDEELILNVVETEFSLAQGMIHASLRLRDRLERAVSKRTKGTIVQIYGSSLAEMATHKSDVDLSIFIPELERQRALWKMGGMGEQQVSRANQREGLGVLLFL